MEKSKDDTEREVNSKDNDGNLVSVIVKKPTPQNYRDSQIAYNKAFREALDAGAFLRQKLNDHMVDQGIWNDKKQEEYEKFVTKISEKEDLLKGGGIRLSNAKKIAFELKDLRIKFRDLLAERNALDANSVEGQADNARFAALVRLCVCDASTKKSLFNTGDQEKDEKAYEAQADQPWVVDAAAELANMIYELDPDYDNSLAENQFLREWKFIDEKHQLINKDGHNVDEDGRLVNEDGRFIAYRTDKGYKDRDAEQIYFVNKDGEEVNEDGVKLSLLERKPFLDDDDNPLDPPNETKAEKSDNNTKATKKRGRTSKADAKTT
tara:strand:+ start:1017 stop:1982 length:966 start_codon:yes stop_codon:yes gene_type:complete